MKKDKYFLLSRVSLLEGISEKTLSKVSQFARFYHFHRGEQI